MWKVLLVRVITALDGSEGEKCYPILAGVQIDCRAVQCEEGRWNFTLMRLWWHSGSERSLHKRDSTVTVSAYLHLPHYCVFLCVTCVLCVYMLRALCVIHLLWTSKCAHMLAYTYLCLVEGLLYASAFMSALWVLLLLAIWSSVSTSSTKLLAVNMAEMSLSFQRSSLHREHSYGRRFFPSSLEAHKLMQRTTIEEYKRIWT